MIYRKLKSNPIFEVTSCGKVRRSDNGKHPKPWIDKGGYLRVYATKDGIKHYVAVHRAVAEAWICEDSLHLVVNHKDSDTSNNDHLNLEWVTHAGNNKHAFEFGNKNPTKGESHGMSKLNSEDVEKIKTKRANGSKVKDLASEFSVSKATISLICNGKRWNV